MKRLNGNYDTVFYCQAQKDHISINCSYSILKYFNIFILIHSTVCCILLMVKFFIFQATWQAVQGHERYWLQREGSWTHPAGECCEASLAHAGDFVSWRSPPTYWSSSQQQSRLTVLFVGIFGLCNLRVPLPFLVKTRKFS